jgi:hypothetical protein
MHNQYPRIALKKNKQVGAMCRIFQRGYAVASCSTGNSTRAGAPTFREVNGVELCARQTNGLASAKD